MGFPTPEIDPKFSPGVDFRAAMTGCIREHFAERLGADLNLLDLPNGLDLLSQRYGALHQEAVAAA